MYFGQVLKYLLMILLVFLISFMKVYMDVKTVKRMIVAMMRYCRSTGILFSYGLLSSAGVGVGNHISMGSELVPGNWGVNARAWMGAFRGLL